MKKYEDEIELKKDLEKSGIRYGDTYNKFRFFVEFVDNKSASIVSHGVYKTPIQAIRQYNSVLQSVKLPPEDVDIKLRFAFKDEEEKIELFDFTSYLSPYLYYKQPEKVELGNSSAEGSVLPTQSE